MLYSAIDSVARLLLPPLRAFPHAVSEDLLLVPLFPCARSWNPSGGLAFLRSLVLV